VLPKVRLARRGARGDKPGAHSVTDQRGPVDDVAADALAAAPTAESSLTGAVAVVAGFAIVLVALNLRPAVVAVAPLIDDIKRSMGWDSGFAGLLTTLPLLMFGVMALLAARCAARFGVERTVFVSVVMLGIGIVIRLWSNPAALLAGSALAGAGIGICNVVLPSLIKRDFADRSGLMTGIYSMTLSGGGAVAAVLAVPLNDAVGRQWSVALALWALPVAVTLLVWTTQLSRSQHIAVAPASPSLWRNSLAWAITILMGTQSLVFFAFTAWLPDMLIDRGMTASQAGAALACGQVAALVMSFVAPIVAGRFRNQRAVAVTVVLVCAVGFIAIITTDRWPVLWAVLIMCGPGGLLGLSLLFMVLRSTSTAQTAQVSGIAQSVGYTLAAVGPVAVGALHDWTKSWPIAMGTLALALIPQVWAAWTSGEDTTMTPRTE
jgi:MFS transporter, CP family, cyanate transporter